MKLDLIFKLVNVILAFLMALWSYGVQLINEEIMVGVFFLAFQAFQRLLSDSSAILLMISGPLMRKKNMFLFHCLQPLISDEHLPGIGRANTHMCIFFLGGFIVKL